MKAGIFGLALVAVLFGTVAAAPVSQPQEVSEFGVPFPPRPKGSRIPPHDFGGGYARAPKNRVATEPGAPSTGRPLSPIPEEDSGLHLPLSPRAYPKPPGQKVPPPVITPMPMPMP
ncbi:hypothetical protein B0O80DRAFT_428529 [Mortierella sp. GBAus27b]|nr:hypothetical protein B0O80DRAFT_428529 [Mortierella sp. GBAus27b]